MKHLFLILILFSSGCFAFDLKQLETQLQQPKNIQGMFTQQKYLKNLNKPISSEGRFILINHQGLLWHLQKPFDNKIRILSTGIEQYSEHNQKWLTNTKQSSQNTQINLFLNLLTGDTQGLAKQFDLYLFGQATDWKLILSPKSVILKQIFNKIELSGTKVVNQITLYEKQGDKTVITFSNQKINQVIAPIDQNALKK